MTGISLAATAVVVVAALLGGAVGAVVGRLLASFPWRPARALAGTAAASTGTQPGPDASPRPGTEPDTGPGERPPRVPTALLAIGTSALFVLTALRFGPAWELPAFLGLAAVAVLLAVIDLQHHLLPNRVLGPAFLAGVLLLTGAAALTGNWPDLLRAGLAAGVLFGVYLVMALISPRSLGMGDVKLAALLGLHLGWLGWPAVVTGAVAGFVVQALVGLLLLASRRIGLRSELPFGPAMLLGAALAIGGAGSLLS